MRRMVRYEWVRLRSVRTTWLLLGLGIVVSAIGSAAYSGVVWMLVDDGATVSAAERLMVTVTKPSIAPLVGGVLALLSVAGDRHHGTLSTTLLIDPRRTRVMVAKGLPVAGLTLLLATVTVVTNVGMSVLVLGSLHGPPLTAREVALSGGGLVVATVGWCAVGLAFGALIRHQVAALAALLVLPFGVERAVGGLAVLTDSSQLSRIGAFLPFRSAATLQAGLPLEQPVIIVAQADYATALAVFAVFAAGLLALALSVFRREGIHPR